MSRFSCPIVRIEGFGKNPNADSLCITQIEGVTVQFKEGAFQKGDWAVYVPVEAVVPLNYSAFSFLKDPEFPDQTHKRIKAKKLRGVVSNGFLVPLNEVNLPDGVKLGQDVTEFIGVKKWEEPLADWVLRGDCTSDPGGIPTYTDIEPYRKYKKELVPGENVVVTEKLHGCNARFCFKDGEFYIGSHHRFKQEEDNNVWCLVAKKHCLKTKLAKTPGIVLFGEVIGVQDLRYGLENDIDFRVFDIYDPARGLYWNHEEVVAWCVENSVPHVPVLYAGPYIPDEIEKLAAGKSTMADHIREGIVIKTDLESWNSSTGRTIFKLVSADYLTRKEGTEYH
jgi:RNA ligase (TIGR02306 family)